MNGEIDVTLPADIKANLKMKIDHGDIYTDFDVKVTNDTFDHRRVEETEGGAIGFAVNRTDHTEPSTAAVRRCSSPPSTGES